jgi:tetratricopeptide (TPR) repeat protein
MSVNMKNKNILLILIFIFSFYNLYSLFSQENLFEKGEKLFMENKPQEAVSVLLGALEQSPDNEKIYLMLGTSYAQLKNYDKAVNYFKDGARKAYKDKDLYFYNAGNVYYLMEQYPLADEMYSRALRENSSRGIIYLNRANTRLNMSMKEDAVADYKLYLTLDPENYQKDNIRKLIALLETRAEAEQIKKQEEELRKIAEEQRKQDMLREVLDSLKQIGQETRKVSAGTEKISDYEEELELKE